jgi:epoxyqueuosine reductase
MKKVKPTSRYVAGEVRRFDQKNNMMMRPFWDSSVSHIHGRYRDAQLRQIERGAEGFALRDFALAASAGALAFSFAVDINRPDDGLTSWKPAPPSGHFHFPQTKTSIPSSPRATAQVKAAARYLGADLVGIAELERNWLYSHHYLPETGESRPVEIEDGYRYVVVMAVQMDYAMIRAVPTALSLAEFMRAYSRMAFLVNSVAQFIRHLGFRAIPSLNDTALSVPLAIDAGLGELGRHGMLVTPEFGPRLRLCKVLTDLPLEPDRAREFGVTRFCSLCRRCAETCPGKAIPPGERTSEALSISNIPGVMKWPLSAERCRENWLKTGTSCGICIRVCPYNKPSTWIHKTNRWLTSHGPSWFNALYARLDAVLGYGIRRDTGLFTG